MSNISYRAKRVRAEEHGLGQPRVSADSNKRKGVRAGVGSFLLRLIGGMIAGASLWILVSRFVVPAIIESAYRGETLPFLNNLISGQAVYPVEHYLAAWATISWRVLGMLFVFGLLPLPLVATGAELQRYLEARYWRVLTLHSAAMNTGLALAAFTLVFYLYFYNPVGYVYFVAEDWFAEYGSFVAWGMASCFLTWLLLKYRETRKPGLVLLALGTFFVAMEEISWGQRILGLPTPKLFADYNLQNETNLHNLIDLNAPDYMIAGIVIFLWAIILPILVKRWSPFQDWCGRLGIPIIPSHLWPVFLLAILCLIYLPVPRGPEWAELFLGLSVGALALNVVLTMQRGTKVQGTPAICATVSMIVTVSILTLSLVWLFSTVEHLKHDLNQFAAERLPREGMYRQAEMLFDYINEHPQFTTPETRFRHGVLLMRSGQAVKAKKVLESALTEQVRFQQERPDSPIPHRIAGQVLALLGREDEAKHQFLKAIEKDWHRFKQTSDAAARAWTQWSLAQTLLAMGDSERALEQASMAHAVAPDRSTEFWIDYWMRENLRAPQVSKEGRAEALRRKHQQKIEGAPLRDETQ